MSQERPSAGGAEDDDDDDEEFHTPRGRDMCSEPEVEWMYADARVLPLPGMGSLAEANPFRWSRGTPDKIVVELESVGEGWFNSRRPVRLRVVGQLYTHKFATAHEAAQVRSRSRFKNFGYKHARAHTHTHKAHMAFLPPVCASGSV